jgi:hypothetical protein
LCKGREVLSFFKGHSCTVLGEHILNEHTGSDDSRAERAHLFSHSKKPFGGIMSNIARTLVADLKLDATGPTREAPIRPFTPPRGQHTPWKLPSGSYEEARALLACFVMSAA